MDETVTIAIVDDDRAMREAIKTLVETVGLGAEGFSSAEEFLSYRRAQDLKCLILDIRMPGMSGFNLQRRLAMRNCRIPIIFMTAYFTEAERAMAIEAGAVDCLQKPFSEQDLFNAIQSALLASRSNTGFVIQDQAITKESTMTTTNGYDEVIERFQGESHRGAQRNQGQQPIRFAGSVLGEKCHVCAFFTSPDEEYRVLLPFIKEGFERGEKAFHVVDPELREAHLRQLKSAGIDVASVEDAGQFELLDWNEYYFSDGSFDEARMLAKWDTVLEGAVQKGYPRTRVIAHLEWCREDVNVLLQYEANFNRVPRSRDPVICTYDLSKHNGGFIIDVMRTHPMIIIGGILQENPFFVPPDEFVRELREREASRKAI